MNPNPPFELLGHAINHIQDCMEQGLEGFDVVLTTNLAGDECFQTVLEGFMEASRYDFQPSEIEAGSVVYRFHRS